MSPAAAKVVEVLLAFPPHKLLPVVTVLLAEARALRRKAAREGFVPKPGHRNRNLVLADTFDEVAVAIANGLPPEVRAKLGDKLPSQGEPNNAP